ncbi:brain acid soluble protein 1-like [Dermacentor albipictus]|uniref:brain acid soluble protein 1-like n=1 Tax=Dermacentor albipictus TaxID=60249 RepID=UPI0038FC485F
MDVSTDTATLGPNAEAARDANKATSQPALGDEGVVADGPRPSSREAAKPSGEATRSPSGDEVVSPTMLVVEEAPRAEGEGATPAAADSKPDDAKPPADAEVASQTDDEPSKDAKSGIAVKPAFNAEPDAPPPTRTFTFKVGSLA